MSGVGGGSDENFNIELQNLLTFHKLEIEFLNFYRGNDPVLACKTVDGMFILVEPFLYRKSVEAVERKVERVRGLVFRVYEGCASDSVEFRIRRAADLNEAWLEMLSAWRDMRKGIEASGRLYKRGKMPQKALIGG